MTDTPEAVRLADFLEQFKTCGHQLEDGTPVHLAAAALLRRIPELEAQAAKVTAYEVHCAQLEAERDQLRAELEKVRWQPIETAPANMTEPIVVRWTNSDGEEARDFDYTEDGCWMSWHDYAEHVEVIGGHGVSYTPPYQQWMPLPAAQTPPHADQKGTA